MPDFLKPGAAEVAVGEKEADEVVAVYNPFSRLSVSEQRRRLPIFHLRSELLYLVEKHAVVVVVGHTGCGKTTQIPQYLEEAGWSAGGRVIACTQPRRISAVNVAYRVCEEMGLKEIGGKVGYSVRFDDCTDQSETAIKYMTDGMLIREMMSDPLLTRYSVIMIDEAHERSISTDLVLGLLKKIQKKRMDLRIIIASATLDAEAFKSFFEKGTGPSSQAGMTAEMAEKVGAGRGVGIISVEGRTFPVEVHYTENPVKDYVEATLKTILNIHRNEAKGDILAFLTGQDEVDTVVSTIRNALAEKRDRNTMRAKVLPLYSGMPLDRQMEAFDPPPKHWRKIVVATNIAESSITIDGIVYVVDSGYVKERVFDPATAMESLIIRKISKSSAVQRAGRAGRNRPGKCFRVYTEEGYHTLAPTVVPELQRCDLIPVVLQLKSLGIDNILNFDFMSPPSIEAMARAMEVLFASKIVDADARLTKEYGETISELPVSPLIAKCLIASGLEYGCSEEMTAVAALMSLHGVMPSSMSNPARRRYGAAEGDAASLLNIFVAFQQTERKERGRWCQEQGLNIRLLKKADDIRKQLRRYLRVLRVPLVTSNGDDIKLRKCLVSGLFANAAMLQPSGVYKLVRGGREVFVHPNSVLFKMAPPCVIFNELLITAKPYMKDVTPIEPTWLTEVAPHFYEVKEGVRHSSMPPPSSATSAPAEKKVRTGFVF